MKTLLYEIYYQTKLYMRAKETIFWNFAFPVFMLIIFGFVFRQNKPISLKVGVVNLDQSIGSREFVKGLYRVPNFKLSEGDSAALFSRLKNRKLDYVLLFPKGFTKEIGQNRARFLIYKSDPSPIVQQIAMSIFKDVVYRANRVVTKAAEPISFKEIEIKSREKRMRYVDYFLPGLIAMIVISTGLFTIGIAITGYREKQVLRRLKVTPLPAGVFFAGQVVSRCFLVLFQALLLMFFGLVLFHTHFAGNWPVFLLVLSLGILSFVSLGFAISSFSRKTETAVMVSNAVFF
ncbi:MAG TPA: ABC transporter permease, partial [Bacteroidetes bacterium]|nr:ABC transporter permease [Bacteroidota bacterium]